MLDKDNNNRGDGMSNKSERITIRLTPEDKEKIKIMAIKKGVTISDMFLVAMMKYISGEEEKIIKR